MDQGSEKVSSSKFRIHSYDQMRKLIVNLGSNKFKDNNNSTCQLNHFQHLLLMSIVNTPEKDLSNFDR